MNAAAAKLLQSCPTLCNPIDGSPPGSTIPGILQARTLEWVAIFSSNAWKWKVKVKSLSHVRLLATPWTAAHQAPPSMGFSRQEYWSGVPSPSPCYEYSYTNLWMDIWSYVTWVNTQAENTELKGQCLLCCSIFLFCVPRPPQSWCILVGLPSLLVKELIL